MTPLDARRAHDIGDVCDRLFAPTPAMLWLERAAAELERQREKPCPMTFTIQPRDGSAPNKTLPSNS